MKIKDTKPMDVALYQNRPVIVGSVDETEVIVASVKPAHSGHAYGTESIKPDAEVQLIFRDGVLVNEQPVETVTVVAIKDSVVDEIRVFTGPHDQIVKLAENQFLSWCEEKLTNWDKYTPEDVSEILENGYVETGTGSICLSWPAN